MSEDNIIMFGGKGIRKVWYNDDWYFSVVDVVGALTDSINPRDYWYKMKIRELKDSNVELSTFCLQLKMLSSDGKGYMTKMRSRDEFLSEGRVHIVHPLLMETKGGYKNYTVV